MNLTEILLEQSKGQMEHIDLSEHTKWLVGLDSAAYWALFQAWGIYANSADPACTTSQRYTIEGWMIDTLFITPDDDWWIIRDFCNDVYEYQDCPMVDVDADELMSGSDTIRNMVLGAYQTLAVNVYQTLRSSDMSNERIRGLFTTIAYDWLDWWSRNNTTLEVLDIDEHRLDYAEFSEAARLLGTLFTQEDNDEPDDIDDDEPTYSDLEE